MLRVDRPFAPLEEAQVSVPSAFPVPIEATIDADEELLLEFVYSLKVGLSSSLMKQFAFEYGRTIRPSSLRHAVIAYAAKVYPEHRFQHKIEHHKVQAYRALRRKNSNTFRDVDAFAACVLSWVAWLSRDSGTEFLIHAQGALSILDILYENSNRSPSSNMLLTFGPYIVDNINFHIAGGCKISVTKFLGRRTTFGQKSKYFNELNKTGTPGNVYEPSMLKSIFDGWFKLGFHALKTIVEMESESISSRHSKLRDIISEIKAELNDPELQQYVTQRNGSTCLTIRSKEELSNEHRMLRCLQLLLVLLESKTIMEGINLLRSSTDAQSLFVIWLSEAVPPPFSDSMHLMEVALGGLILGEISPGKFLRSSLVY